MRVPLSRKHLAIALLGALLAFQVVLVAFRRSSPRDVDLNISPLERGERITVLNVLDVRGAVGRLSPSVLPPCASLIFFTPTCEYCIRSAPQWARDFGPGALPAVGIGFTTPDSARAFAERFGLRFPVYAQSGDGMELTRQSRVLAVPRVAQLDSAGTVVALIKGGPYDPQDIKAFELCRRP